MKPGVRFVQTAIRSIDPVRRRVETDAGAFHVVADQLIARHGRPGAHGPMTDL